MPRPARRWLTVASVALLTLGLLTLYLSQRHDGLFENGPGLMELWRRGIVVHAHALLLPLAHLAAALGLAGSPPVPDRAVSLISSVSAAMAVAAVVARATQWSGLREALLAGLVMGLAPVLRFYAGAVETRAIGCGFAAVAGLLASRVASSRARAIAWATVGYSLAFAAHASLFVLGPALLLLHADAESRAGRPVTLARLVGAGAVLVAGAAATGGIIFAADQLLNPVLPNASSSSWLYFSVSAEWGATIGRPHPFIWTLSEILGPANLLVPFAVVGFLPLLRRAPWRAAALGGWVLCVAVGSYGIGSRQLGGYFLSALPALGWLAAEGLRHLFQRRPAAAALRVTALTLLAIVALPAMLGAWHATGVDDVFGSAPHRPWLVRVGDLALPWNGFPGVALAQIPYLVWLAAGALAALLAGAVRGEDPDAEPRTASPAISSALPTFALVAVALALQVAGGESFRQRWPIHWSQQTRDYCEAIRGKLGPHDRLFTAVPSPGVTWQFNYYLGDRWTDLGQEAYLDAERHPGWMAGVEAELARVRAEGGTAYLAKNGLEVLEVQQEKVPLALAAARRWIAENQVVVWSLR